MTLRLLAVHAHPDDESSKGAATYAYYAARGDQVMIVSCTGGERGSILNEHLRQRAWASRDMGGLRRHEMAEAQKTMGIEHRWLGYYDSGLPDEGDPVPEGCFASIPLEICSQPLTRLVRAYRPHVIVTYDEQGGYPHPDHIQTHRVAMRAIDDAAREDLGPEFGAPWQVQKLYYERVFNYQRLHTVAEAAGVNPGSADDGVGRWLDRLKQRPLTVTTQVPCGAYFDVRDAALRCHESQVDPNNSGFFWPNDVQLEVWPYEDYQLIDSRVRTEIPEDDLFAGVIDDGS